MTALVALGNQLHLSTLNSWLAAMWPQLENDNQFNTAKMKVSHGQIRGECSDYPIVPQVDMCPTPHQTLPHVFAAWR